jgi:hypothetical protein
LQEAQRADRIGAWHEQQGHRYFVVPLLPSLFPFIISLSFHSDRKSAYLMVMGKIPHVAAKDHHHHHSLKALGIIG